MTLQIEFCRARMAGVSEGMREFWKPMRKGSALLVLFCLMAVVNSPGATLVPRAETLLLAASVSTSGTNISSRTPAAEPLDNQTKTKVGFMAGAGLLILALLGLGTALALVRAFRR